MSPVNTLYTLPLYLNSNIFGPEWKIGFHTYMLSGPSLTSAGICGAVMNFHVSGATPGSAVAYVYARGLGNYVIGNGPCIGTMLGLDATVKLGGISGANASGDATFSTHVPAGACGRIWVQALDLSSCGTTNVIAL